MNKGCPYDPRVDVFVERELKLEPPSDFVLPPLDGVPLDGRLFTSAYYDTPSRSLARVGITLRRRVENGLSTWQLKLPRKSARAEISAPGGPAGPPPELRRLLTAHLRHGALENAATLRTRRSGVRVGGPGHPLADVTIDAVVVLDGAHAVGSFVELEVELVDGEPGDLERLGRELRRAGAKRSDGRAKVMRVLQVADVPVPSKGASAIAKLRHMLTVQLRELERHDPGVRLDDDPEDLHRFRVATRRARALIRATRPMLGNALDPLGAELKWLAGSLGPVRDLDVLIARLRVAATELGGECSAVELIVAGLEDERAHVRDELAAAMSDDRYLELLTAFEHAIGALPGEGAARGGLRALAAAELRRLVAAARRLPSVPSDAELHGLRIRAKRARYAAELFALTHRGKRSAGYLGALKRLQDVIGDHQDAVVGEERLRRLARPETALAAGRLIERECTTRRERRAEYPQALDQAVRRGEKALA